MSLPALHNAADTRTITEKVNVLIRDYNGGRVDDLAQALADIAALQALHDGDVQVFLGSNVSLNNTGSYFAGPNTGSIGAAGQKWLIAAAAQLFDSANAAVLNAEIHNGSGALVSSTAYSAFASARVVIPLSVIVTLAAATTFTLRARDSSFTTGTLETSAPGGAIANRATWIMATRLK